MLIIVLAAGVALLLWAMSATVTAEYDVVDLPPEISRQTLEPPVIFIKNYEHAGR
jgi:hypothetical protein